ncbi:MAG: hypothetical protein RL664_1702 [Bacteroidota bacterium]
MKKLLLLTIAFAVSEMLLAQRLIPFVANNQQHILNDAYDNFLCNDGEVFHDSLFVSVNYGDTLNHPVLKVLKGDTLTDVPLDWDTKYGRVYDLFSTAEKLYAVGTKKDSVTNVSYANLAILENGVWSEYSYPDYTRFSFGTVFSNKVFLFSYFTNKVCFFENGSFYTTYLDSVIDAQVHDDKMFYIKEGFSGMYYIDTLGVTHSEEIACDSLMRFSMIDGQLFVSGKCNEFLFRRNENGEWVFDDLGIDFSLLNTAKLGNVFRTQKGYLASFTTHVRSQSFAFTSGNSYELAKKNELNKYAVNVISFEGRELAICRGLTNYNLGAWGGICTVQNGWMYQFISNELVSERSYPSFSSFIYENAFWDIVPRPIGLNYKNKRIVFICDQLLFGMKGDVVSGVGGLYEEGLNGAYSGPVSNNYSNEFAQKYNRVWSIKQTDIAYHNQHWYDANYSAPIDILEWPGNGSIVNGEPQIIAPFHDVNGNNIYEPQFGDAPEIKGDEATFYIVSDGREVSQAYRESNFESTVSKLEMSVMTYLFHNSSNPALSNTVFTDYRIVLRDEIPLNEFYFGMHVDFDIGTSYDDFIGCDSTRNLIFGYNADDFDEPSSSSSGYFNEVPACGYRFLNKSVTSSAYFSNSSSPVYGTPFTNEQAYRLLQGKRIDGSSIINPITLQETSFMFGGEVGVPGVWNEESVGNFGGDRRLMVSASLGDLQPNTPVCISVARIAASDTLTAGSRSINAVYKMKQYSDEVQQYYDQYLQTTDCNQLVGVEEESEDAYGVNVYPNPSSDRVAVQTTRSSICKVELFNPVGSLVYSTSGLDVGAVVIDVNAYAHGLYSVRVYLKDGTVEVRKIIVE